MNTRTCFATVAASAALLSACGGGSSSNVIPAAPATSGKLSLKITWQGESSGSKTLSSSRRYADATLGAQIPVVLVAADRPTSNLTQYSETLYAPGEHDTAAFIQAEIIGAATPAPGESATPLPSFSWSSASNVVALASATPISQDGNTQEATDEQVGGSFSTTITASVPSLNLSQTTPVYAYNRLTMSCTTNVFTSAYPYLDLSEFTQGASISGGVVTYQSTPNASDIYVSGNECPGSFASNETSPAVHFPHGAVMLPTIGLPQFLSATASQWTSSVTSLGVLTVDQSVVQLPGAVAQYQFPMAKTYLFKCSDGSIAKFYFSTGNPSYGETLISGPIAESGNSPDGF